LAFASLGTTFRSSWNVVLRQLITDWNRTMNRSLAVAFGGLVMLAAAAAFGQEAGSPTADPGYVYGIGPGADGSARDEPQSSPLFTIGGLDVQIWAPVEPHYNGAASRDPAGEPFWNGG
jgi:hypothetical protein